MTTAYTSLLGLALPVTGELSGTWGDTVNTAITTLLDSAVAGTTSITADADTTLSTTTGAANQARQAIILWNPASGTTTRNITAPAQSKMYTVINASGGTQSIVFRGAGPTTGVTIVKGESAVVAWNGTDFIKVSNSSGAGTFTNLTVSGTTTLSGLTASTALALNSSKEVVSVTNTGTGNNVLSASPTLTGTVAGASLSLSSLTSGRVTYATTAGLLTDDADLTFDGTTLTTNALTVTNAVTLSAATANGVVYANGSKVLTTGSALTFDGTNFTVTQSAWQFNVGATFAKVQNTTGTSASLVLADSIDSASIKNIGSSIAFLNSASEGMRLTSTGLGIGTSSPAQKLQVAGGRIRMSSDNVNGGDIAVDGTGLAFSTLGTTQPIIFSRNNYATESMRLDSSGNLGLGVTPSAWFSSWSPAFEMRSFALASDANTNYICNNAVFGSDTIWRYVASKYALHTEMDAATGQHRWYTAPSGTAGNAISFTQAMTLDASGNLGVGQTNPSAWLVNGVGIGSGTSDWGATIYTGTASSGYLCFADGASGTDRYRGYLQYNHILDAMLFGTATTERARIDSSGNLLVGTTTNASGYRQVLSFPGATVGGLDFLDTFSSAGTTVACNFRRNGTSVGSITTTLSGTLYNITSDQRLKENIQDAAPASALIDALQVREYDWKSDGTHQRFGFIAQELVTVAPEAVHQPADPEAMMAVDYSKLVPMLVKEIQSLRQRLAAAGIA